MAEKRLRSDDPYYEWVGKELSELTGAYFPSARDVLRVLFFCKSGSPSIRDSAYKVLEQVKIYWQKTKIPVIQDIHAVAKIEGLLNEWKNLVRSKSRVSETEQRKRNSFISKLDMLFDISKKNSIEEMDKVIKAEKNPTVVKAIQEEIEFLVAIRSNLRSATLGGRDVNFNAVVSRRHAAKQRSVSMCETLHELRSFVESKRQKIEMKPESLSDDDDFSSSEAETSFPSPKLKRRGRRQIMTAELAEVCDVHKVSGAGMTKILAASASAFGINLMDTNVCVSSVKRQREKMRRTAANVAKDCFEPNDILTVHWDGKIVKSLSGRKRTDRQAIVVTGTSTRKLLAAQSVERGTGKAISTAVCSSIRDWKLVENVKAMAFDTTSTNTGKKEGAAVLIEKSLAKPMLWLPCRHHVYEIVLQASFHSLMGGSKGPEVEMFNKFQLKWPEIDQKLYCPADQDGEVSPYLTPDVVERVLKFTKEQIHVRQPRDDYLELLELSIIFLGAVPPGKKGITFREPGPTCSARWMAKAIYALKVWLFRGQFQLKPKESKGLLHLCIFIVTVYVEAWFLAPYGICAPRVDLQFYQRLIEFEEVNKELSSAAVKKMSKHCWYLSEVLVAFAFFDEQLSVQERKLMFASLRGVQGTPNPPKSRILKKSDVLSLTLPDLVSTSTLQFFETLNISSNFLNLSVEEWHSDSSYQRASNIVKHLFVTNDEAERRIKLIKDYNRTVTQNESSFQDLLQNVETHRRTLPDMRKTSLAHKYHQ